MVKRLLPYPSLTGTPARFTTTEELPAIKAYVTPQLYSQLWDWALWVQKAINAIPEGDSIRMNYELLPSANIFIDSDGLESNAPISQVISGDSATVTVVDVLRDKGDGHPIVSKTKGIFSLVKQSGSWVVSDVTIDRVNYQPQGESRWTLFERLQRDIVDFKKKEAR